MKPLLVVQCIAYWSSPDARRDLESLRVSLMASTYPKESMRVLMIDNPAPFGTARAYLEQEWMPLSGRELPSVEILSHESNDGFSGGHARGFECAQSLGAAYVCLVNQDAYVAPDTFDVLVAYLQSHPRTLGAQPVLYDARHQDTVHSAGNSLHYLGFGYTNAVMDTPYFYLSGAVLMLSVTLTRAVGGLFDARYFMYHEDTAVCWRARLAGWDLAVVPQARAWHRYEFSRSRSKFYWIERNRWVIVLSYYHWRTVALVLPLMLAVEMGALWFAWRGGWLAERVRVYRAWGTRAFWRLVMDERRRVRRVRRKSDREMLGSMAPMLDSAELSGFLVTRIVNPILRGGHRVLLFLVRW